MKFNIGDIVQYIGAPRKRNNTIIEGSTYIEGTVIDKSPRGEYYCVDFGYPFNTEIVWSKDLKLIHTRDSHKNNTDYWRGFDDGYVNQKDEPQNTFFTEFNCDTDELKGYRDGLKFAQAEMLLENPDSDDYENGYDDGYDDSTNGICFKKTVTTGRYSERYDDGYITGYYHGRSSKKTNNRQNNP